MPKICHNNQQPSGYLSIQTVQMQHKKVAQNNLKGINYPQTLSYFCAGWTVEGLLKKNEHRTSNVEC